MRVSPISFLLPFILSLGGTVETKQNNVNAFSDTNECCFALAVKQFVQMSLDMW